MSTTHDNQRITNAARQMSLDQISPCAEPFRLRHRNDRIVCNDLAVDGERLAPGGTGQFGSADDISPNRATESPSLRIVNVGTSLPKQANNSGDDEDLNEFEHNACTLNLLARLEELEQDEIQKRLFNELERKLNGPRPRTICCTDEIRLARRKKRMRRRRNYFENAQYFDQNEDYNSDCPKSDTKHEFSHDTQFNGTANVMTGASVKYWLLGRHSLPDKLESIEESSSDEDYQDDEDQILSELNALVAESKALKAGCCDKNNTNADTQLQPAAKNQTTPTNRVSRHAFGKKRGNFVYNIDLSTALDQLNQADMGSGQTDAAKQAPMETSQQAGSFTGLILAEPDGEFSGEISPRSAESDYATLGSTSGERPSDSSHPETTSDVADGIACKHESEYACENKVAPIEMHERMGDKSCVRLTTMNDDDKSPPAAKESEPNPRRRLLLGNDAASAHCKLAAVVKETATEACCVSNGDDGQGTLASLGSFPAGCHGSLDVGVASQTMTQELEADCDNDNLATETQGYSVDPCLQVPQEQSTPEKLNYPYRQGHSCSLLPTAYSTSNSRLAISGFDGDYSSPTEFYAVKPQSGSVSTLTSCGKEDYGPNWPSMDGESDLDGTRAGKYNFRHCESSSGISSLNRLNVSAVKGWSRSVDSPPKRVNEKADDTDVIAGSAAASTGFTSSKCLGEDQASSVIACRLAWKRRLISPPLEMLDAGTTDMKEPKTKLPGPRLTASLPRDLRRTVKLPLSVAQMNNSASETTVRRSPPQACSPADDAILKKASDFYSTSNGSPAGLTTARLPLPMSPLRRLSGEKTGSSRQVCFSSLKSDNLSSKKMLPPHVFDVCRNSWPDDQSLSYPSIERAGNRHSGSVFALGKCSYGQKDSVDSYLKGIGIVAKLLDLDTERLERFRRIDYIDKRIKQLESEEGIVKQDLAPQKPGSDISRANEANFSTIGRWSRWQRRRTLSEHVEHTRMVVLKLESEIKDLQSKIQPATECQNEKDLLSMKFKLLREARRKFDELEFSLVELETKFAEDEACPLPRAVAAVNQILHASEEGESGRAVHRVHSLTNTLKRHLPYSAKDGSTASTDGTDPFRSRHGSCSFSIRLENTDFCGSGISGHKAPKALNSDELKDQLYHSLEHERQQVSLIERTIQSLRAKLCRPFLSRSDSGCYDDNTNIEQLGGSPSRMSKSDGRVMDLIRQSGHKETSSRFNGYSPCGVELGTGVIGLSKSPDQSQFIHPVPAGYSSPRAVAFHRMGGRCSLRGEGSNETIPSRESEPMHDRLTPCSTHASSCSPRSPENDIAKPLRNVTFQNAASNDILSGKSSDDLSSQEREEHSAATNCMLSLSDCVDVRLRPTRCAKQERPLTRYLPLPGLDLDLRQHVENAGHMIEQNDRYVSLTKTCCRGHLVKMGQRFRTWHKRWFVFDRNRRIFAYYSSQASERKGRCRGQTSFQSICEVYVDHLNIVRSPSPRSTFVVKTMMRTFYLVAPSAETMRIWVDVLITGAEGHLEYQD